MNNNFVTSYNKHQDLLSNPKNFLPVTRQSSNASSVNTRAPFSKELFDLYRPNQSIPKGDTQESLREAMVACNAVYQRVGVVKSVVDMMSEFAAEGIEIVHTDDGPSNFYKVWQKRVKLEDRCERLASWILRSGNGVVRRIYGEIDAKEISQVKRSNSKIKIPLQYIIYDPSTIELIGDSVGAVSTNKIYALRIPLTQFYNLKPKNDLEKQVFQGLPDEIKRAIEGKKTDGYYYIQIPSDKIFVGHYKKDDSQIWARSFIYSILSDIYYNDTVKQAKISAMDGIINVIRVWKLGDHKSELLPSPAAGAKLAGILANHVGGGAVDIIWDSAIELSEHYPPVEKLASFEENYQSILLGLGIPESLVGGQGSKSGNIVSTINLKNLIKRLETVRRVIKDWIESEIDIIQENMGFRKRPEIRFANADLYDDRTYFTLLRELVDRNILPDDRILEIIGEIPEYEKTRLKIQETERENGDRPPKASPFHQPNLELQQDHELRKIKEQNSYNLSRKGTKESDNGRPPGSIDKVKRQRGPNRVRGDLFIKSCQIYDFVDNYINDLLLKEFNKSNLRLLTASEKSDIDNTKLFILPHIHPNDELNNDVVIKAFNSLDGPSNEFLLNYNNLLGEVAADSLTNEEKRILRIMAYAESWGINNHENI
jgi:hypothetical protein